VVVTPSTATVASGTGFVYADSAVVTWSDNAYNESGYQITRTVTAPANLVATPPMVFNAAGSVLNNPLGTATGDGTVTPWTRSPVLSFTDNTGLIDGVTYQYAIAGSNVTGTGRAAAATKQMPGVVINPPSNLIVTPNRAGLSIGLQWSDASTNETDFFVEESVSTQAGAPGTFSTWTPVATVARTAAQSLATGGLVNVNRANVPVTPGFVYTFRVSARNLAALSDSHPYLYGQASLQGPVFAATGAAPTLAVPTIATTGRVTLSWTAVPLTAVTPSTGITMSYRLFANGVQLAQTNRTTFNYRPTAAALQAGITFTVQAVATAVRQANPTAYGSTVGPASNPQSLTVVLPAAPATPTNSAVVAAAGGNYTSNLTWTAVTGATRYVIQPVLNGLVQAAITVNATAGATSQTRAINLVTGNTYTYTVAAASAAGVSLPSPVLTVNTPAAASTGVSAAATGAPGSGAITVVWNNLSVNLLTPLSAAFKVERRIGATGALWVTITPTILATGPTSYNFTDATGTSGTRYSYRIIANSAGGISTSAASAAVLAP
jgi:hypothetical protein